MKGELHVSELTAWRRKTGQGQEHADRRNTDLDTGSLSLIPCEELHNPVRARYPPPAHRGPLRTDVPCRADMR
jgi:hypothetical protein